MGAEGRKGECDKSHCQVGCYPPAVAGTAGGPRAASLLGWACAHHKRREQATIPTHSHLKLQPQLPPLQQCHPAHCTFRGATPPHPQPHSPRALKAGGLEPWGLTSACCMYLAKSWPIFGPWLPYLYCRGCKFWKAGRGPWVCTSGLELRVEWGLRQAHNLCLACLCPNVFQH